MAIQGEGSGTDGVLSNERNWSELPQEVIHLFSKKLHDIFDFIRFRAVCKTWQLSAPVTDLPPQFPWLLELRYGEQHENDTIRFYSLLSGKVHTITGPGSSHASLTGPGFRYLLASHLGNSEMYLLNPLTCDQIHVPFVNVQGLHLDYIGPDPIEGGDIVIVSRYVRFTPPSIAFWRPKADDWVYVERVGGSSNAFYMGQYFSNDGLTGITDVIDIATKKLAYQVAPPEGTNSQFGEHTIMVESGGKIIRMLRYYDSKGKRLLFHIYCLYFGDGERKPCWVKISDIGDQMLFLQAHGGLSFCASNIAGFKGNCIYYINNRQYIYRYDIGDGTTEVLPCPFDSVGTWFVPSLV